MNEVRPHISALAMAAANKVVGASLDQAKQEALINDFFAGDEDPGLAQAAATIPQQLRDPSASPFKVTIDEEEETVELKLQ